MTLFDPTYQPGDWVIYRKTKYSTHPGPRAQNVSPSQHGEKYAYTVDKFWVVSDTLEDGRVVLHTRRGKEHVVDSHDPGLHRASWLQRVIYRGRFIAINADEKCAGKPNSQQPNSQQPNAAESNAGKTGVES